ncbi:AAA domain-containing protein [Kaistella jeonii]|uniref:ATPase AAA n=1 Tax=Kaistella jeonii TaxID=266749 RepID=A0A0C1D5E0_9FLAO|nr:AAA domain-containing protein [Kaistella jeonii]KIA88975.1 ATPase AAA [Kaistella jeonii]SFB97673.1 Superfamily I DNA and/or RNA helicase [Kaistella jeonii]VEI97234.1 putative DNA helicase [Kaistella jeonii]
MLNLSPEIFEAFQNKLKTGNRRGVHLNAIPGNSRYKLDLAQLSEIHKSLPEHFIVDLLTQKNVSFKFSIHDQIVEEDSAASSRRTLSFEEDKEETEAIENEENPASAALSKDETKDKNKEKLSRSLENLIFQNEVIYSEKGVNSLGFGFPILIRKDVSDGQISASPLLIWSINIKPTNEMNTWEISRAEDDPIYLNEVLINHLQSDSGVILDQLSEEMLSDGKIDKPELFNICETILSQLKVKQNLDFIMNNYAEIAAIKTKAVYETLLPKKGDAFIIKSGIFSIFEVQKQNIINDYEVLKSSFKPLEDSAKLPFQSITSIETDPSQQGILQALKSQNKILIQGPPGTGKSQTLTAVLVNALENKQKTIVVCEKQTALEVLYNALHKMGYARYCTMIKDSISDRKLIVNSVRNLIDPADFKKPMQLYSAQSLSDQITEITGHQNNVNTVHHLLNTELLPEKNWSEIVGNLLEFKESKETLDLQDSIFSFSKEEFTEIETLRNAGESIYREYEPFIESSFLNTEKLVQENFLSSLQNLDQTFHGYQKSWEEIQNLIRDFEPIYIEKKKQEFGQNLQKLTSLINETEIMTSTLNSNSEEFLPEVTEGFFYKLGALFSSTKKRKIQNQKRLTAISSSIKEISLNPLFPTIEISGNLWNNKNEILNYRQKTESAQTEFSSNIEVNYESLDFLNLFDPAISGRETETISQKIQNLKKSILNDRWTNNTDFGNTYLQTKERLNAVFSKYSGLRNDSSNPLLAEYNWFSFHQNLSVFQKGLLEKLYPLQNWKSSFLSAYFSLLLKYHSDEKLNFNEQQYAEIIKKLKVFGFTQKSFIEQFWNTAQQEAVKNFEKDNKDITVANLYNKRSSINHTRLTLRQIAQKDTDLFTTFFPIILTTPDVCSNLFQNKNLYFDYVVFDEASQLKLEDNLPALLKGKNIIIAGDEHQMPPSNYFSKVFDGSTDDEYELEGENEVITYKNAMLNIESLLDFAMENNFEKNHLDFHYRSRHPYLIDFSNHAFYNSRLKPLPAQTENKPIEFFQVDGIFNDHINTEEADKVLEILAKIEPDKEGKYPSVGIATFNITQRNYIKRKIVHQINLPENELFKEKIQGLEEAGLFIKNLENIQGDERDIIIISTTYGRKPSGKFVQSFGPVNHSKGYKLLNVIITRAKEKIYICNSIPEEFFMNYKDAIEQEGANNRKAVFYSYLAYCKAVSDQNEIQRTEVLNVLDVYGHKASTEKDAETTSFINQIEEHLKEKFPDLKIAKNHHFGGYVLDLLIEKPDHPSIIVECMSKEKYDGELGYLEDLHKAKILQNSGFKYVRIWSQNCWLNLDSEIQKIVKKLG